MTAIVAWCEDGKVWMGGDSAGVNGLEIRTRADSKVFKNSDMLFGYTSSFRLGQLLRFSLTIPEQPRKKDDYVYLCTDFIDAVAKVLEEKKYAQVNNNEISIGVFLIGYKGNIYRIDNDLQVGQPMLNYEAVGCGVDLAMGALYALNNYKMEPKERILSALKAACEFSAGVRPPFVILSL